MVTRITKKPTSKKPTKTRAAISILDKKYLGEEPQWSVGEENNREKLAWALNYYNYLYKSRDLLDEIAFYAQTNFSATKEDIRKLSSAISYFPITAASLIMCNKRGMHLSEDRLSFIKESFNATITKKVEDDSIEETDKSVKEDKTVQQEEPKKPDVSIQDRIKSKANAILGAIEGDIDDIVSGKTVTRNVYDFLITQKFPVAQINRAKEIFATELDFLVSAKNKTDESLTEGYKNIIKNKNIYQRLIDYYGKIATELEMYQTSQKAAQKAARRPKIISKDKLVSGIKYQKDSKEYKIASINPVDIIGAKELWCFDTKTRKLIKYVADKLTGPLSVKGTCIVGFSEAESSAKTLRKPIDQLSTFMKATKVALRTFLKDINAVEVKPNGRININIVLLKVL